MISLHAYDAQDWSGNGICALFPEVCNVKEMAAGLYELELVHPITDDGRALSIQRGMLIKAPVPTRETPLITNWHDGNEGQPGHVIYRVEPVSGTKASLRTHGRTDAPIIEWLKPGTEVIYQGKGGMTNWSIVTAPSGNTGKIYNASIVYVRTEPETPGTPGYNTVVKPRQVREQLFRVYDVDVNTETNKVKALARHIFYDQLGNFVKTYNPKDVPLQAALNSMAADLINSHEFGYFTNIIKNITAEWALKNAVQAVLDPDEGAAAKRKAQVVRDNFDTFLLQNTEIDRGVVIENGKNLLGVQSRVNDENVITRIMPYGTDKAGKILLLPEVYLDSQYILNYPNIRAIPLQVQDAVERDASGDNPGMTKAQAYEKMRQAAQDKFDAGCDLPDFDIQVDFVHLGDTVEYAAYKGLQQVFLYDTVTVKHGRLGMLYKTQVIGIDFNGVLGRYNGVTLGNIKNGAELGGIAGFQLPNGGISGTKLVLGSVGSGQLRELSVLAAHIGLAQIVNAHIQDATIDKAKIKDFAAEVAAIAVAKIGEAWIDVAWIGKLSAEVVDIVTANIGTVLANSATINWAQIANLTAAVTDIVLAKIQTANIGWAKITGLVADTALFTQGASGKLYCADFMATDANIESLSANKIAGGMATFGKLMLRGQDGKLYEINVGSLGEVTTTEKQLEGDNIGDLTLTDRNLADGTLTARTLNVQQIFGDSALVRQLIAQNIDVDTLFANLGFFAQLKTSLVESDIGGLLRIMGDTGVSISVKDAVAAAQTDATAAASAASAAQTTANGAYQHVTGVTIQNGLVEIIGHIIRMISAQIVMSDDADGDAATLIVDTIEKAIKAQNVQASSLLLNGDVTGAHNLLTKVNTTTLSVTSGGSIQAVIDSVPKFLAGSGVTINVPAGTYVGDVNIPRFLGGRLTINFAAGVTIIGRFTVAHCSIVYLVGDSGSYANIIPTADGALVTIMRSYVYMRYLRLTGKVRTSPSNGTLTGVQIYDGSVMHLRESILERITNRCIDAYDMNLIYLTNVIGGQTGGGYATVANLGYGLYTSSGSIAHLVGNIPTGEIAAYQQNAGSTITPVNVTPTQSSGSPAAPTIYQKSYVYDSAKYCDLPSTANMNSASSVWSSGAPRGGLWSSQDMRYSGMWLLKLSGGSVQSILTGLAGKTIESANLRIHCDQNWASNGIVTHDLYYMRVSTLPVGGDSPGSKLTDTGVNVDLVNGEDTVVNLKNWLQSMVNAGTAFYGFGLGLPGSYAKMNTTCTLEIVYS